MNRKNEISTSLVSFLSSVLAYLGIVTCCGFPLVAASLAWLGIGASQLHFLSQYQWLFTSIAIMSLIYGFYTVYFENLNQQEFSNCCGDEAKEKDTVACSNQKGNSKWLAKAMLWIGLVLVTSSFFIGSQPNKHEASSTVCCTEEETSKKVKSIKIEPDSVPNASQEEKTSCCTKN